MSTKTQAAWEHMPEQLDVRGDHVAGRRPKIVDSDGQTIAEVWRFTNGAKRCEIAEGYARLISQAPAMAEALKGLIVYLREFWPDEPLFSTDILKQATAINEAEQVLRDAGVEQ